MSCHVVKINPTSYNLFLLLRTRCLKKHSPRPLNHSNNYKLRKIVGKINLSIHELKVITNITRLNLEIMKTEINDCTYFVHTAFYLGWLTSTVLQRSHPTTPVTRTSETKRLKDIFHQAVWAYKRQATGGFPSRFCSQVMKPMTLHIWQSCWVL
jgi:hypothetical protein